MRPPAASAIVGVVRAAVDPATKSPIRGPPATTTVKTPCSRPRRLSGAATCSIVDRYAELIMSAAPLIAKKNTPSHSARVNPNASTDAAYTTTDTAMATPWRRTLPTQPENANAKRTRSPVLPGAGRPS